MKKTLIALFAFTLAGTGVFAQQGGAKMFHHKKHQHGRMAAQLNLTEQQKKQSEVYRADFRKKMQELNKLENITVKEQRDRREALKKDMKQKMDGLLTSEQKATMARLKAERKAKADVSYANRLGRMKEKLSLSEAQVSQLKKAREENQLKMKGIRENESLTREQRREKMMALQNDMKEQRNKILTVEQQKKMEELKKKKMENKPVK